MKPKWLLFYILAALAIVAAQLFIFPLGVDYYYTFQPAVKSWFHGQAIFDAPYYGFFNAPWLVLLLVPSEFGTLEAGQALLLLFTLTVILAGWRFFSRGQGYAAAWSLAIILFNLHVADLVLRGQIDGFVLLGLLFMYQATKRQHPYQLAAGWFLAAARPTSIILLFPYTLWRAYQENYFKPAFAVSIAGLLLSFLIFDPQWPWRWYTMIRFNAPPNPGPWFVTWWRAAETLHWSPLVPFLIAFVILSITMWSLIRYQPDTRTAFAFLSVASLLITPYGLSYHYSVLMAVFIPPLLQWKLRLLIPIFLLTLTPLLRVQILGLKFAWVDIFLPLFVWGCYLFYMPASRK